MGVAALVRLGGFIVIYMKWMVLQSYILVVTCLSLEMYFSVVRDLQWY